MIIGIGSDLCDITRIKESVDRFGDRFLLRIFSETERAKATKRANSVPTYAKRWAAKEACAKALGTGINHGVYFRDMEVVNLPSGQPTMRLSGGALRRLQTMIPGGHTARIHLSLTDDHPWAQAFVVIEAVAAEA